MIRLTDFALRRGGRLLLSEVSLTLHPGWRVGVIGRNGCGKSSLFAALLGHLDGDSGSIDRPRGQRVATVAQETPALPDAAIDYVIGGDAELSAALVAEAAAQAADDHEAAARAHHRIEELDGYDARARAGRLLHGLGFTAETHDTPVREFSGGWRVRLNLARALMAPSDLLLLDEPTNHLDLDAVVWLEDWLRRYEGTLLVISHDREFLDGVATHIVHLHEGRARLYTGDYTSFERQRAEQLRQQQIAHEKEQVERAHLQSFIDRFKAKASKAKQAQSRMKRLEKLAGTEAVRAESPFRFSFAPPQRLPSPLLRLDDLSAGYSADSSLRQHDPDVPAAQAGQAKTVLTGVKFSLEPGERVALLGPNGAGKSTLVKTLVGDLPPLAGERLAHKDLRIGYFAQHTVESLREGATPMDHLRDIAPGVAEQVLRNYLGSWNFAGERAFENVDTFSGGERARVALALIAWHKPNVLLLDEPTNHLDLDMREALAEALADFGGALVLVAHDRHLIGLVCDTFWRVAEGSVSEFNGDLDDYARWLRGRDSDTGGAGKGAGAEDDDARESAKERRRAAAEQRAREKPVRDRLKKIETRLATIESDRATLETQLADPELYSSRSDDFAALLQRQRALVTEQETLEEEWLNLQS
ncbi:ABC-F family ATP-binding cassette domain-containing protein [Pseudofulvimonas gallinarii]|uniref:ABC-F family ATP-binding cassette domain-containing protein n=1 Tax=Pseudofulvimonas gallinarii TaxID=634155 RepID=UPI000F495356|nr:ATP-binding cassette domain-containing protein [Pseudofulvimonas gallinarii]THD13381.1 ABC transporter ATP-binding protein [Pseudofulvimonas gallinarii]